MAQVNAEELKKVVREQLGSKPSAIFMDRVYKAIDGAGEDQAAMAAVCKRVQNMIKLFIDDKDAVVIGQRFNELLN